MLREHQFTAKPSVPSISGLLPFSSLMYHTLNNGIVLLLLRFLFAAASCHLKGIEIGKLSLVSPIAAVWAMITALLSILLFGEALGGLRPVGILLVILGTALSAFKWHNLKDLNIWNYQKGVLFALIALFGWV